MKVIVTETKLNHLLDYIIKEYQAFGPRLKQNRIIFGQLKAPSDIILFKDKPLNSFKDALFPSKLRLDTNPANERVALLGLNNCDLHSLHSFTSLLAKSGFIPSDLLVVGMECKPNHNCFCSLLGKNTLSSFDLFLQQEENNIAIFTGSKKGEKLLKLIGLKDDKKSNSRINPIKLNQERLSSDLIYKSISNKTENDDTWQALANNCFGCGSCSAVCPLCTCFKQHFETNLDGTENRCLEWDSCFAKRFSEVQHHYDFRPTNKDRYYNWYHHKFVRNYFKNNEFLCTGCGRCIEACPANLNIINILKMLVQKQNEK